MILGNGMIFKDRMINIDTSHRCTLECPKCMRQHLRKNDKKIPGDDLSFEDFKKLTKYFKRGVNFCGQLSDPIFNPNFIEMLRYCYENNIDTKIATAASHKKVDWYEKAFKANKNALWVFGLDGLPKDSHKYRINQDGVHLFEMMKLGKKLNNKIVWQYIVFRYNENDVEECRKMAKDNDIYFDLNLSGRWSPNDKYKPLNPKYYLNRTRTKYKKND